MQELIVTILLAVLTGAAGILLAVGSRPGSSMTKRQRRMLGRILGASLLLLVLQLIPESAFDAWDSLVPGVQTGKYDMGMAGMTVTDERKEQVNFSDSYATGVQVVIVKDDSPITSVDDLFADGASTVVGTQAGTTGFIYATSDIEDAGLGTVKSFGKTTDAVEALKNGQVDCVILDNEPAKALVAANEGLHILDTEYAVEDYAIAIAKENTDLLEKVNKALAELTADGTLQSIVDKYIK